MAKAPEFERFDESEALLGPWRSQGKGEIVDPEHISHTEDGPIVPVRIYGDKPPEKSKGGRSKGYGNGHVAETSVYREPSVIPNQGVLMGETLIVSSADIFVAAPTSRTETPRNETRASRPWSNHTVGNGIQVKGPGRVRGYHLTR